MSEFARKHLADRAVKVVAEINHIFADCDHWNRTHPEEVPIDPDPDGALSAARSQALTLALSHTEATKGDKTDG